jgi:hypothetical protein
MNRRRFLEYAGATAAVVGGTALGLDLLPTQQSNPIAKTATSSTSSTVITSSLTLASSTKPELASLSGRLFFDYNGNGVQDAGEPAISGSLIQLKDNAGRIIIEGLTDSSGDYRLEDIRTGEYKLHIGVDQFGDKKFRYMCRSSSELRVVDDDYEVALHGDSNRMDVGLSEGSLTLPFRKDAQFSRPSPFGMTGMVDVDRRPGFVRSYDPEHVKPCAYTQIPPWVCDQHDGIDYCFPVGTDIVAAAPGTVMETGDDETGAGNYVVVHHQFGDQGTQTLYAHLSEVIVKTGASVSRNQPIAKSGNSGVSGEPHLHFRYATWTTPPNPIDPYRDLLNPSSLSSWTVENSPQYP